MSIINANIFIVIAFNSTNHAMAGEQAFKDAKIQHLILPLPTAISSSCGLAIKVWPGDQNLCHQLLTDQHLNFTMYLGTKNQNQESYQPLNSTPE